MKRRSLHWALWSVASTIVVLGSLALQMASSATHVPFVLASNQDVATIDQHRLTNSLLQMTLQMNTTLPEAAKEQHGNWSNTHKSSNPQEAQSTIFPEPGLPIELDMHWGNAVHAFEALPASSTTYGPPAVFRDLVPRVDDKNPHAFGWPVPKESRPILPAGTTRITVKMLSVPKSMEGQAVVLIIKPRVSFKYTTPGYELLWWFYFWPAYMVVLGGYGAWLLRKSSRCTKRRVYHDGARR